MPARPWTIALDATYSLADNTTGVGTYCREVLSGLARAHPEARFLFCYRSHQYIRSFEASLPPHCHRRLLQEPFVPRSADLFHGLNQRLPHARLRRAVTTFQDLFVMSAEYSSPEFRRRFTEQARHAAAESDLIIAASHYTAGQIHELLGVEPSRIRVIHHGVHIQNAAAPQAASSSPPGVEPSASEKTVLSVGTLQKRKNITRLVRAFEALGPEWKLVLAGATDAADRDTLAQIENSPRRADIRVLGYVTPPQLQDLYARAAIFAFPSLGEGFGLPVLEAMAAGVCVLTSNCTSLPEVGGDAALFVDPLSTDSIAGGLQTLARDEALRSDLVRRGLARAAEFTWERTIEKTWGVYQELLRQVKPAG
jgi:glycosyltransferase involved in cell wall biosynthesis